MTSVDIYLPLVPQREDLVLSPGNTRHWINKWPLFVLELVHGDIFCPGMAGLLIEIPMCTIFGFGYSDIISNLLPY